MTLRWLAAEHHAYLRFHRSVYESCFEAGTAE